MDEKDTATDVIFWNRTMEEGGFLISYYLKIL